jgi:hypothetical protein
MFRAKPPESINTSQESSQSSPVIAKPVLFKSTLEFISETLADASSNTNYQQHNYPNINECLNQFENYKLLSGGNSGASIYKLTNNGVTTFLKYFSTEYILKQGHRIVREVYGYLKINEKFHDNESIDFHNIPDVNKLNIGFPKLLAHGKLEGGGYYLIITKAEGVSLFDSVKSNIATTSEPKNSNWMWYSKRNVLNTVKYVLTAYRILCDIFGAKFRHVDYHPDNIFVFEQDLIVTKVTIIDFDLIESDLFLEELRILMPIDPHHSKFFRLAGLNTKIRYFYCYCTTFTENKQMQILDMHTATAVYQNMPICDSSATMMSHVEHILPDLNYLDIRYIYLVVYSLNALNKILISKFKSYTNDNPYLQIKSPNIADQQSVELNLNLMYDNIIGTDFKPRCKSNTCIDFNTKLTGGNKQTRRQKYTNKSRNAKRKKNKTKQKYTNKSRNAKRKKNKTKQKSYYKN